MSIPYSGEHGMPSCDTMLGWKEKREKEHERRKDYDDKVWKDRMLEMITRQAEALERNNDLLQRLLEREQEEKPKKTRKKKR